MLFDCEDIWVMEISLPENTLKNIIPCLLHAEDSAVLFSDWASWLDERRPMSE